MVRKTIEDDKGQHNKTFDSKSVLLGKMTHTNFTNKGSNDDDFSHSFQHLLSDNPGKLGRPFSRSCTSAQKINLENKTVTRI